MRFSYHQVRQNAIDSVLRSFEEMAEGSSLESLLSVGATFDRDTPSLLSAEDSHYSYAAFMHLALLGLKLSSHFSHASMNILNGDQEDFLRHPAKCDVLLICHIPFSISNISPTGKQGLRISPNHFIGDAWSNAARTSGAKVIFTFGGTSEINPIHFLTSRDFLHIPEYYLEKAYLQTHDNQPYHSRAGVIIHHSLTDLLLTGQVPQPIREYLEINLK